MSKRLQSTLKSASLQHITARKFTGGLDLIDSEYNLSSEYARVMKNLVTNQTGDIELRYGTRLFAELNVGSGYEIIALEFYYRYLIAVDSAGVVYAIDSTGTVTTVWDGNIALGVTGNALNAWTAGASNFVSFTQFQGELLLANGVDKPLLVKRDLSCNLLQDLATGSNLNVPTGRLILAHNNYVIIAGDQIFPGRIWISNQGTSGTWVGDTPPNDGLTFDVDKYVQDGSAEITGLASFRDLLVVFFPTCSVTMKLGEYNDDGTVHQPKVVDVIDKFGTLAHKAVISTGDQLYFLENAGVSNIRRALITGEVTPDRLSRLIDPAIQTALSSLSTQLIQDRAFSVYDKNEDRIIYFLPNENTLDLDSEATVYAATVSSGANGARRTAWHQFTGWSFRCGCTTTEGRVFFAYKNYILRMGNRNEPIVVDYENIKALPVGADTVEGYIGDVFVPAPTTGTPITFDYELPYNDLRSRAEWKQLHYVSFDSQGSSKFTFELYTDGLKNRTPLAGEAFTDNTRFSDGYGWMPPLVRAPYASMQFCAGGRYEFALSYTAPTPYRPAHSAHNYAFYGRFRLFKLRIQGESASHFRLVSVTLSYSKGKIY